MASKSEAASRVAEEEEDEGDDHENGSPFTQRSRESSDFPNCVSE